MIKRLIHRCLLALMCASLVACSDSNGGVGDEMAVGEGEPILFMTVEVPVSRARPLSDFYDNFLTHVTKSMLDNSSQCVMDKYVVRHKDGRWSYVEGMQYEKFWDLSASRYLFCGVAPADAPALAPEKVFFAADGKISLPEPTDASVDLMGARTVRRVVEGKALGSEDGLEDYDSIATRHLSEPQYATAGVPMLFHHLLSRVEFRVYSEDAPLTIDALSLAINNFGEWGTYDEAADNALKWTIYGALTDSKTLFSGTDVEVTGSSKETANLLYGGCFVPQTLAGITFTAVKDGETGTLNPLGEWLPDWKYVYYLKVSGNNIILIDVLVEPWTQDEDLKIENPVVNW